MLGIQIGSINIALRIFIVERWTFGGMHCSLDPTQLITVKGHLDLTARRREESFEENQTFGTIFYSRVSKMQHNDQGFGNLKCAALNARSAKSKRDQRDRHHARYRER
jgi:hypothetical protein